MTFNEATAQALRNLKVPEHLIRDALTNARGLSVQGEAMGQTQIIKGKEAIVVQKLQEFFTSDNKDEKDMQIVWDAYSVQPGQN